MNQRKDMAHRRLPRRSGPTGQAGGFTILEMMITVVVLGMMIASFSAIIVQCNRVVSTAQTIIRGNAKIAAIGQILRRDVQRATKGGIMAIRQWGGDPVLILTTGEPVTTLKTATECIGSYVVYGLQPNGTDAEFSILWRPEYGFPTERGRLTPADVINTSLAQVQALSGSSASSAVSTVLSRSSGTLYYPPEGLSQIDDIWQVLTAGCSDLTIMWTDGSALTEGPEAGRLIWHDSSTSKVWTSEEVGTWPKAILVRFRLTDPHLPEGMDGALYEIICELPP